MLFSGAPDMRKPQGKAVCDYLRCIWGWKTGFQKHLATCELLLNTEESVLAIRTFQVFKKMKRIS